MSTPPRRPLPGEHAARPHPTEEDYVTEPDAHPLDYLVRDPSGMEPLCGEDEFAARLRCLVAAAAPRVFAIVQEYGERVDARIGGWGVAFGDHAEVVSLDGGLRMRLRDPADALDGFRVGSRIRAHLVWLDADVASPDG